MSYPYTHARHLQHYSDRRRKQEEKRLAVRPGDAQFISIRQVLSDSHSAARHVRARPGASIPTYQWRQMRHGQFGGESIKSLILSFNIQQYEFCAQI